MANKMTPRAWAVYRALRLADGKPLTQFEIAVYAGLKYNEKATNCKDDAKGDHCKALSKIVAEINASPEVEKIVVVDKYTYRLADREEAEEAAAKYQERGLRLLAKAAAIRRKAAADGQGKVISCQADRLRRGRRCAEIR